MADAQFDKDFGYLMPFLDKIAAAANNVTDPAAREEFSRLIAGEKSKWARIRQLLSGAQGQHATPSAQISMPNRESGAQTPGETKATFAFTVGSLRPRK